MALAALAACTSDDQPGVAPTTSVRLTTTTVVERTSDGTLVLGIYLPITGAGSNLGVPMVTAVEAAVDQINEAGGVLGREVQIERTDEGAGTGPGPLLEAGVDAIVGPASSLTALSQLGAAVDAQTGVVVCSPTATTLALDDYPDNSFLFRTVPSDSLQMAAIARRVERTGAASVAVGYLDDPYGRGLFDAFQAALATSVELVTDEPFSGDQEDLSGTAAALVESEPGVVVVLGDANDGGRLLAALDDSTGEPPIVIINDSIREARQTIQTLSDDFRTRLIGVAPLARPLGAENTDGYFTAHATDCVNLIALATIIADSDAPKSIRSQIANASSSGQPCTAFAQCAELLGEGRLIDYNGNSGSAALSNTTGDPLQARFQFFQFDETGAEVNAQAESIQTRSLTGSR